MSVLKSGQLSKHNLLIGAVTVGAVTIVGLTLLGVLAAADAITLEGEREAATTAGNVATVSDPAASEGQALQFGAPSGPGSSEPSGSSTPPTPSSPGGGGPSLWTGDFETGDFSQFLSLEETSYQVQGSGVTPEIVQSPVRKGNYAAKFTLNGSSDGVSRAEITPLVYPDKPAEANHFYEGDEFWFGHSVYLDPGFPVDDEWQVLFNWHHHGGPESVPIESFVQDGEIRIGGNDPDHPSSGAYWERSLGSATTGQWMDFQVHVKFSDHSGVGSVEVWRDGEQVMPTFYPDGGTIYDEPDIGTWDYWKFGYYRDGNISTPGTVYYDEVKVGTSRESVAP